MPPAAWSSTPGATGAVAARCRTALPPDPSPQAGRRPAARTASRRAGCSDAGSAHSASRPEPGSPTSSTGEELSARPAAARSRSACVALALADRARRAAAPGVRADWPLAARPHPAPAPRCAAAWSSDSGFSTKSNAPRRVASTAVSTVPCPDIMTTGQSSRGSADHSRSSVMPSVSGIQMSSSTRSGALARARGARLAGVGGHIHFVALLGEDLLQQPADVRLIVDHQNSRSGHTRSLLCSLCAARGPPVYVRVLSPSGSKIAHAGPARASIIRLDAAAVLLDDLLHDREPQAGALGLLVT